VTGDVGALRDRIRALSDWDRLLVLEHLAELAKDAVASALDSREAASRAAAALAERHRQH
jgi:hypothetical protein